MTTRAVRRLKFGRWLLFARVACMLFAATWSLALIGRPLLAQSTHEIVGTWQGTLNPGRPMRIVLKISKPDGNAPKGAIFNIDQSPYGIDVQSIALQGSALKFAVSAINGSYEGTLSADNTSIEGTMTLQGKLMPLNLVRATADTAWALPEKPKSMPADAKPVFDAVTIKPAAAREGKMIAGVEGRHLLMAGTSLNDVIGFAYSLDANQIVDGPAWSATRLYDMDGVANVEGMPDMKQFRAIYQALLIDRFQLTSHHEKRVLPVYAITVAKGGSKLTRSTSPADDATSFFAEPGAFKITNKTMAEIADMMKYVVERPVVDQTGLTGRFNFVLKWTPDEKTSSDPNAPPDLFTAIQEQLGLKLEAAKSPVDVIVIDHVEPPSAN